MVKITLASNVPVEMIIIFGSYARGDWVEDVYQDTQGLTYEYKSDHVLLLIVAKSEQVNYRTPWRKLENRIRKEGSILIPVHIIGIDISSLNQALSKGQYFYTDIKKEGVLLHDSN